MAKLSQSVSRWIMPFLWGLAPVILLGGITGWREITKQHDLGFHLYYNALSTLTSSIDRLLPLMLGIGGALAPWYWGRRLPRGLQRGLRIALPIVVVSLYIAGRGWGIGPDAAGLLRMSHAVLLAALRGAGPLLRTPTGWCSALAILALLIVGLALRRQASNRDLPVVRGVSRGLRVGWRLVSVIAPGCAILLVVIGLALHFTVGVFHIKHAVALRDKPNVIFIMVDTLRADHLGCYGYDLPVTPNIDRFARQSTRFTGAVAPASWTMWSVNAIMTSRYPDMLYPFSIEKDFLEVLQDYYPMLPEALHEQGYSTNAISSNPMLTRELGVCQGYDYFNDALVLQCKKSAASISPKLTDIALARLSELKNRKSFTYLVYVDPHWPYYQHAGFTYGKSQHFDRTAEAQSSRLQGLRSRASHQRTDWRTMHDAYNSEVGYVDHCVGKFLEGLKQQHLYDNALIVFFSDHGEEFLEHGAFEHQRTVYNEVLRVPLLIKFPHQQQGKVVDGPFSLLDLYPSLMAYLHADAGALGLQGDAVNLSTLMRCADKPIFSSTIYGSIERSVIHGQYKLIQMEGVEFINSKRRLQQTPELYDLSADPGERHDLAGSNAKIEHMMSGLLQNRNARVLVSDFKAMKDSIDPETLQRRSPFIDPAITEKLRSLGYLQ